MINRINCDLGFSIQDQGFTEIIFPLESYQSHFRWGNIVKIQRERERGREGGREVLKL